MKRICINSPAFTRIYDQLIAERKLDEQDFVDFEQELKMSDMFNLLKEGLEGIIEHQKGNKKLSRRVVEVPEPAIQYKENDVKRIRKSLDCSQHYTQTT